MQITLSEPEAALRELGLTETEARIYCQLARAGASTGYRIAKDISKAAPNVYAALDSLANRGAVISDMLALAHNTAMGGIGGHRLAGFAEIDRASTTNAQLSVSLLGSAVDGVQLPRSAQNAHEWDTPPDLDGDNAPGSWDSSGGRHCMPILGYDALGVTYITWGGPKRASWGWRAAYGVESWAPVFEDWLSAGLSPAGFDMSALLADMRQIAKPST